MINNNQIHILIKLDNLNNPVISDIVKIIIIKINLNNYNLVYKIKKVHN